MFLFEGAGRALRPAHGRVGLLLVVVGEILILARFRPFSDYSFPLLWFGYILVMDAAVFAQRGRSLSAGSLPLFLVMFPVSAAFWWIFELFNLAVHSWIYVGAGMYSGFWFVVISSLDFSTVLPAVWLTALAIDSLLPARDDAHVAGRLPPGVPVAVFVAGILSLVLAVMFPGYAFGLIWVCLFFLLDPINYMLGRRSVVERVWHGDWRIVARFAPAALVCGFFWESWNYWADPKWMYSVPHVGFLKIFEMPVLGYSGYLPFGLELFAMANFVLPFLGFRQPTLALGEDDVERAAA